MGAKLTERLLALADPGPTLQFPDDALRLKGEFATIARILKNRFPNVKIAYYSSRIYAGYATTNLNPEPFAYQSGFAVKWLIEDQINGSPDLNFDSAHGAVQAPWLAWGPYLWADGTTPRSDGLTWGCADLQSDGTHPAPNGAREKVANMLLNFFKTDSTAWRWFVNPLSQANTGNGLGREHGRPTDISGTNVSCRGVISRTTSPLSR